MNNKMKKFSFKDVNVYRSNEACASEKLVSFGTRIDKDSKKHFLIEISLHSRAAKQAGFNAGEYVSFDYDDGVMLLKLDRESGRKISAPSNSSSKRPRLRFAVPREYYGVFMDKRAAEVEIENGAICFKLV
jgi:hypothetical protein